MVCNETLKVGSIPRLTVMADRQGLFIQLYLDEDVYKDLAPALPARGFQAPSVHELARTGLSDADQLAYAASRQCALFPFNAPNYIALHAA